MDSQDKEEIAMTIMSPRSKQTFFADCHQKHKELGKSQREYKTVLSTRLKSRDELIIDKSYAQAIDLLQQERNDIRAQIWVANARCHTEANEKYLKQIQCHVKCQDRLSVEVSTLKEAITNLQREKRRVEKQIYEFNLNSQHHTYVAQMRKKLQILENSIEIGGRRESELSASNAALRREIKSLLTDRNLFDKLYKKYVNKLFEDQKYLMDLLEYASQSYENAIDTNDKILNVRKRMSKESEKGKIKVQNSIRDTAAGELVTGFMNYKNQPRPLANLQAAEKRRRARFKSDHVNKIKLYNTVMNKILHYTHSYNVDSVIDKFQQHETLYHSFFCYSNRLSFNLTSLETKLDRVYDDVLTLKTENSTKFSNQIEQISTLEAKLEEQKKQNAKLVAKSLADKKHFELLCNNIVPIFNMCRADASPVFKLLGNHNYIDLYNLSDFMKILESRLLNIVRSVFVKERETSTTGPIKYVVRALEMYKDIPTSLDDIVLAQECAECAEGEVFDTAEDCQNEGPKVMSTADVKKKLFEEYNHLDVQYRLHSISDCRLPKSRELVAMRNA